MNNKTFVVFPEKKQANTFKYIIQENIIHSLKRRDIPITTDLDDDFTCALFGTVDDMLTYYPYIHKKGEVKIDIIGLTSHDDISDVPDKSGALTLTQSALNCYLRCDDVFIYYSSQIAFLNANGVKDNVTLTRPSLTFYPDEETSITERKAFKSYYQIPEDRRVVICLGEYNNKETLDLFNGIARVYPEYTFLFFGETGKQQVKIKLLQRLAFSDNALYLDTIPELLYHSALLSADAFLIPQRIIIHHQAILDFMAHGVPIIAYRNDNYHDLVNDETSLVAHSFAELYHIMKTFRTSNKTEEAERFVDRLVLR